ncbi:MAG: serine/threonine-protein kinase [Pseudomonadota bacterium]
MSEPVALTRGLLSAIREGEILGGKYRLEREIGRGSMGTVWSAVHVTLGQRVAIKLISAEHAQSGDARARFSTEAKAAARLRSRYVVQVYDDGETPAGTPYIVLEYLDGETLEQRLERDRDLPLNDAVRVTRHVARALSRAHASGIVHRDLKPGNVFLSRSEDDEMGWLAKVLDFGIAKLEEHGTASTTKTGALLGTPLFMSPEQVRGANSVDSRSDLYSLGMVFYNMLTGRYAFNGESFADVLVAICTRPLPDLREAAPWVPASVAGWFQRACARDLQQRFQSADEMIEALDLALGVALGASAGTGASNHQSSPERRPDTLRGHLLSPDQALLRTNHAHSAHPFDPELAGQTSSRPAWVIGSAVALVLLVGGAALLLAHEHGVRPTSEVIGPPRASVASAAAVLPVVPASPASAIAESVATAAVRAPEAASSKADSARVRPTRPAAARPAAARPAHAVKIAIKASPRNASTDMGF